MLAAIVTAQQGGAPRGVQQPNRPEVYGTPGSPEARITIDGRYLPKEAEAKAVDGSVHMRPGPR